MKLFQKAPSPRAKKRFANNRCPVEETGKNSVMPSTMPRIIARSESDSMLPTSSAKIDDFLEIRHRPKTAPALLAYSPPRRNGKKRPNTNVPIPKFASLMRNSEPSTPLERIDIRYPPDHKLGKANVKS